MRRNRADELSTCAFVEQSVCTSCVNSCVCERCVEPIIFCLYEQFIIFDFGSDRQLCLLLDGSLRYYNRVKFSCEFFLDGAGGHGGTVRDLKKRCANTQRDSGVTVERHTNSQRTHREEP